MKTINSYYYYYYYCHYHPTTTLHPLSLYLHLQNNSPQMISCTTTGLRGLATRITRPSNSFFLCHNFSSTATPCAQISFQRLVTKGGHIQKKADPATQGFDVGVFFEPSSAPVVSEVVCISPWNKSWAALTCAQCDRLLNTRPRHVRSQRDWKHDLLYPSIAGTHFESTMACINRVIQDQQQSFEVELSPPKIIKQSMHREKNGLRVSQKADRILLTATSPTLSELYTRLTTELQQVLPKKPQVNPRYISPFAFCTTPFEIRIDITPEPMLSGETPAHREQLVRDFAWKMKGEKIRVLGFWVRGPSGHCQYAELPFDKEEIHKLEGLAMSPEQSQYEVNPLSRSSFDVDASPPTQL